MAHENLTWGGAHNCLKDGQRGCSIGFGAIEQEPEPPGLANWNGVHDCQRHCQPLTGPGGPDGGTEGSGEARGVDRSR